jgi:hypothetical protein
MVNNNMAKQGLNIVTDTDYALIMENLPNIILNAQKMCAEKMEPTLDEVKAIQNFILDHIRKHQRIIYGGYAQNKAIELKNPADVFYKHDWDIKDIEFYSTHPMVDIKELADGLHTKGYKDIMVESAMHDETYTLRVNGRAYSDIAYIASISNHKIRTFEYDGLKMVHPHVALIDYYRMINDMLGNAWRMEKNMKRMYLLQKYYPIEKFSDKGIKFNIKMPQKKIDLMRMVMEEFLLEHLSTFIATGFDVYNYYIMQAGFPEAAVKRKKSNIYYLEYILLEYNKDVPKLINFLRSKVEPRSITYVEHYPFFQYYGSWIEIFHEDNLIVRLFAYNDQCVPYNTVSINQDKKILEKRIATLDYMVMLNMMHKFRTFVEKNDDNKDHYFSYQSMISNLIEARDQYLESTGTTILDKHPYRIMNIRCIGYTISAERKSRARMQARIAKGKPARFRYKPGENKDQELTWNFMNTSGNAIQNVKKLKFIERDNIVYYRLDLDLELGSDEDVEEDN